MKKKILLIIIAILLFEVSYYFYGMIQVAAGYNAKVMCSCVYISGRTPESVLDQDIGVSKSAFVGTKINREDQTATASFLGIKKTAVYRPGLGCTLLNGVNYQELISQPNYLQNKHQSILESPWPTNDTVKININNTKIEKALQYAFDEPDATNPRYTRAVVIVHRDQIIAERYGEGITSETPLIGWSMTKSVTNSLIGILINDGKLSLSDPAPIPQWHTHDDDPRAAITIDDLMHMTSGLKFDEVYSRPSDVNEMLWKAHSSSEIAIQKKLDQPINTHWSYSSGTTNILSQIIRDVIDDDKVYQSFPYDRLFGPLGMSSALIEMDASGTFVGSSLMYANARDWAKWGQLYLDDGVWLDKRILPEGWVDYSRRRTPINKDGLYAAQFWNNAITEPDDNQDPPKHWPHVPSDAYYAAGYEGQNVVIIPSLDLVIVRLGCTNDSWQWDLGHFVSMVVDAIQ